MSSTRARAFLVGAAAGALALFLSYILRIYAGGSFLPELAAQTLVSFTPGSIESGAVETLGSLAKYTAFSVAVVVNVSLYGLIAVLLVGWGGGLRLRSTLGRHLSAFVLAFAVIMGISLALQQATQIATQRADLLTLTAEVALTSLVFGFTFSEIGDRYGLFSAAATTSKLAKMEPADRNRRLIIKSGVALGAAIALLYLGFDVLTRQSVSAPTVSTSTFYAGEVTSNDQFYRVDINIFPPSVDGNSWNLSVGGLVDNPQGFSLADLTSMPSVEEYATLECVSNTVGGNLMSSALWKGVRLSDVLQKAGVGQSASYVVFNCTDGYDVGIPLPAALADGTILAYEMNGQQLSAEHGYPLRAIVPGFYGMMNPKWITGIQLTDKVYLGFWQQRGWANAAMYQTESAVVTVGGSGLAGRFGIASPSTLASGTSATVAGVAFAGDRGISKVEVSFDGGNTWSAATLKPPLSGYTWVLWSIQWIPPGPGDYKIEVRATDGDGNLQTSVAADPFPNGATGYDSVGVSATQQ